MFSLSIFFLTLFPIQEPEPNCVLYYCDEEDETMEAGPAPAQWYGNTRAQVYSFQNIQDHIHTPYSIHNYNYKSEPAGRTLK